MAAVDNNNNGMDDVDYEHISPFYLYVGNHFDQHFRDYLKNQPESPAIVPLQQQQPNSGGSQSPAEIRQDHPTPRQFEKICHATADPACERLAAETRQNVKLIEPRTAHTYRYKDAKTGEMVEKGVKPDMVIAFSHDGVRGKNVVVDAKSHKGAIRMSDYEKLDRDRRVTKSSYAILFLNTNSKVPDSVLEAVKKDSRMDIIYYNGEQPDITSKEFVNKVGPHVAGSGFQADDQRYEQNRQFVQQSDLTNQKFPNPLGNQNSELTKNTHRHLTSYDFQHPRKPDGSLDKEHPVNEGLKDDGTLDMRLKENKSVEQVKQHQTQDGEPDKRFNDNKSEKQMEAHVTKEGEPDHRYKANQEQQHEHLKADGTPDERFRENKNQEEQPQQQQSTSPNIVSATNGQQQQQEHLKDDGTPDMRFKENKDAAAVSPVDKNLDEASSSSGQDATSAASDQPEHVKDDGTPDMRFKENKEAAAVSPLDKNLDEASSNSGQDATSAASDQPEHMKDDGTPDMRFKENKDDAAAEAQTSVDEVKEMSAEVGTLSGEGGDEEHLKGDGTLDMRYNSSKETVAEMGGEADISGMSAGINAMELGGAGGSDGPLKADGTPDMRFSANQ